MASFLLAAFMAACLSMNDAPTTIDILPAHATAYCIEGITKSGEYTREGICAGKEEWLGKKIFVYQKLPDGNVGKLIGEYDCLDTGGTPGLNNGSVVDIWRPDLEECQEFMNLVYEDNCKGEVYIIVK